MRAAVSLARCDRYEAVDEALDRCLAELGGMRAFVRPGARVLLKVNLVSARKEDDAVTTHPAVVAALIRAVRAAGGEPSVGDSPGLLPAPVVAKRAGIAKVCRALEVPVIDLDDPVGVANPRAARVRAFRVSRRLAEHDLIVSVPKLKTHVLVGMTGAVKNLFGCIPGTLKSAQHLLHQDPRSFAGMLLDLAETIPAALTVVDAIVGQEGPGPGAGVPRRFGLLAAGTSALAVDVACAQALGLDPREVATLAEAARRRAPFATAAEVELLGERLRDVAVADLARPRASATMMLPKAVLRLGKRALTARPSVHAASCRGCGDCARICGAEAITMIDRAPRFDDERCIRCLCCHEICPAAAIDLRAGPLARLLGEPAVRTSR